jgi:uncharacterized repeat protein (TIGR01451 family)
MSNVQLLAIITGLIFGLILNSPAHCQAPASPIEFKTTAQIAKRVNENGHEFIALTPADRVVPGDEVLYTVEVRNSGPVVLVVPAFTTPVPTHMVIVPGSAVGPGAEVSYSVDGGRQFDMPDRLTVPDASGRPRAARPDEYTHMRWLLHIRLRSHSVAYVRYRAILH